MFKNKLMVVTAVIIITFCFSSFLSAAGGESTVDEGAERRFRPISRRSSPDQLCRGGCTPLPSYGNDRLGSSSSLEVNSDELMETPLLLESPSSSGNLGESGESRSPSRSSGAGAASGYTSEEDSSEKGAFGAVFSDTLNISYHGLRTGLDGNVFDVQTGARFDIHDQHRELAEIAAGVSKASVVGSGRNIAVFGITVIGRRDGDSFEAFSSPLRQQKEKSLVFVSGTKKYGKHSKYQMISFTDMEENLDRLQRRFLESGSPVVERSGLKLSECNRWSAPRDGGASVDSEQHAIREIISGDYFNQMVIKYKRKKIRQITREFSLMLDRIAPLEGENYLNAFEKYSSIYREKMASMEESIVGFIIHVDSTNDMCCYCAASLSEEFIHRNPLPASIKLETEDNAPIVLLTVSASKKVTSTQKPGIGEENRLDGADYEGDCVRVLSTDTLAIQSFRRGSSFTSSFAPTENES